MSTKKLLEKFYSMKGDYSVSCYFNPCGLISFNNEEMTIFAQFFHNTDFERWFKYFIKQFNVKDIISVEKTKYGTLIVKIR